MEKHVAFSEKIDVQQYGYFRFELTALEQWHKDVEISVEYGSVHDAPGTIIAKVWARIAGEQVKQYLYTMKLSQSEVALEDYAGIAHAIYDSPSFVRELQAFVGSSFQTFNRS